MKLLAPGARILASRLIQVAANAAVVLLVATRLGPVGQGYYSLTLAVGLLLASVLAGGQGLAAVPHLRRTGIPARRIWEAQILWAGGAVGVLALLALFTTSAGPARFLADHLGWPTGLGFVVAVAVLGILLFEIFSYDLLACGRLVVGAVINGFRAVFHLLLVGALILLGTLNLSGAVGLVAVAQVLGGIAVVLVTVIEIRRRRQPRTGPDLPEAATPFRLAGLLARQGWLGQLSAVAYFLLLRLDQGLLEHFHGAAEVGVYSVAVYFGEMLWLLPGALTPLLVHSAAAAGSSTDRDADSLRAVRWGFAVTLLAGLPLYFLAGPLLPLLAGGAYSSSAGALRALLPGIVAFAPGTVLAGDFIGRGRPHWNTQASLITLLLNIGLGLWLIPTYGAVGAGWSSSLAYACGTILMLTRFLRSGDLTLADLILGKRTS